MPFEVTRIRNRIQLTELWKDAEEKEQVLQKYEEAGVFFGYEENEHRFADSTDYETTGQAKVMELIAKAVFQAVNDLEKDVDLSFIIQNNNSLSFNISLKGFELY